MIQDIAPKRMNMTYLTEQPREEDPVFCFLGGEVLLSEAGRTPRFRELPRGIPCRYLFSIDDTRYFMGDVQEKVELAGFQWESQRALRGLTPMDAAFAGFTAQHLAHIWPTGIAATGSAGAAAADWSRAGTSASWSARRAET